MAASSTIIRTLRLSFELRQTEKFRSGKNKINKIPKTNQKTLNYVPFDCLSLLVNLKQKPDSAAKTRLSKIYQYSYDYLTVALIIKRLEVKANYATTGWQFLPWHSKMDSSYHCLHILQKSAHVSLSPEGLT